MDDRSQKIQTVVEGEADESEDSEEEDAEVREISAASANVPNLIAPRPLRPGLVVAGEASESDEEEIDTGQDLPPLKVNTDGRGDTGDLTRQLLREESHSPHIDRHTDSDRPKYDTLLHKKLRDRNMYLRRHLVDSTAQMYVSASKDLHNTTQQLMKTQLVIQDVSHNMRLLTNDLFHLEDRIDIISSCNLLPDINIQL